MGRRNRNYGWCEIYPASGLPGTGEQIKISWLRCRYKVLIQGALEPSRNYEYNSVSVHCTFKWDYKFSSNTVSRKFPNFFQICIERCLHRKQDNRSDDNLEIIRKRMKSFDSRMGPMIQHSAVSGTRILKVDSSRKLDEVHRFSTGSCSQN